MGEERIEMPTREELKMKQGLPLEVKVRLTEQRIREWVNHFGVDGVYVSFSGGKDSTVLLDIARRLYPGIPAVFVNTGLEYPEIQSFVRSFDNVEILRPKLAFPEVIKRYGYPFISKDKAKAIYYARKKGEGRSAWEKAFGIGRFKDSQFSAAKYSGLITADYLIGSSCCNVMKKSPIYSYNARTGRKAITGTMAAESSMRASNWLKTGCNSFTKGYEQSKPLSFWLENDALEYIKTRGLQICSVYGDVVVDGGDGFDYASTLYSSCRYRTTGCDRTGCIFCGFGAHLDKGESRFERLKRTHPKQYAYCMGGGEYDERGLWVPNKDGLGMAHVIDDLNARYGKDFIRY